jgi:Protein of unknown function (DUF1572)
MTIPHANADASLAALFLDFSRTKLLGQYWPRMRSTVESLTDEQIWWLPNPACNSIGNLLLHLNGNVGQWLVASFNGRQDARDRPAEFNERDHIPGKGLLARLSATLDEAAKILDRLTPEDLAATYEIQGYESITGLAAVYQVVEHFGMHYGQILYIAKSLRGEDLGFYSELNKTGRLPAAVGGATRTSRANP